MTSSASRRWSVALALLWAAMATAMAARMWGFALDDFFITYRYAWNLLAGEGFVFNPGERVFGTTAPGMGLLVAALAAVTRLGIPEAGAVLTAAALWSIAWLLWREARRRQATADRESGRAAEAAVGGTLMLASTFLWVHVGAEGPISLAFLLAAAALAVRRPLLAGLLAAAAVWCRPDAGLGACFLGLLVWAESRRFPWRLAASGTAGVGVGLATARLWFGRFLPETLHAKRLQAEWMPEIWAGGGALWGEALGQLSRQFFGRATATFVVVGLIGAGLALRRGGRGERLLVLYGLALAVAYPLLGVAYYGWYLLPTVIVLYYGVAWAAGAVARWAVGFFGGHEEGDREEGGREERRRGGRWTAAHAVAAVLVLLVAWPAVGTSTTRAVSLIAASGGAPRFELYRHVGRWIRRHVPEGEGIAYVEVGTIAFFGQRPVRDLLGLVSPESLPWVERGDMVGAFLAAPTPWLIYDTQLHGFIEPIRQASWFPRAYSEKARFSHPESGEELILYRRRPGAVLPAAAAAASNANGSSAADTR